MRLIKEPLQGCLVHYRKCCNEAHKGAIAGVSSILQEVL